MTQPLTDRHKEVLIALATTSGSDKAIARKLGIVESTVNSHLREIFIRIGVHSRVQAAVYACKQGWVW